MCSDCSAHVGCDPVASSVAEESETVGFDKCQNRKEYEWREYKEQENRDQA